MCTYLAQRRPPPTPSPPHLSSSPNPQTEQGGGGWGRGQEQQEENWAPGPTQARRPWQHGGTGRPSSFARVPRLNKDREIWAEAAVGRVLRLHRLGRRPPPSPDLARALLLKRTGSPIFTEPQSSLRQQGSLFPQASP